MIFNKEISTSPPRQSKISGLSEPSSSPPGDPGYLSATLNNMSLSNPESSFTVMLVELSTHHQTNLDLHSASTSQNKMEQFPEQSPLSSPSPS